MGCFPACFGHLRRDLTTKKVQHQCLSPSNEQHESVKLLSESHKDEEIVNPIKLISQFQDISNEEKAISGHSNVKKFSNELASSSSDDNKLVENGNGKVEKEREEDKEEETAKNSLNQDLLMNEKECLAKEESCCSSLFTLSIDSRKHFFAAEMGEKEVSSLLKSKKHEDEEKENLPLSKDPMMDQLSFDKSKSTSDRRCGGKDNEMAVETSLSSWLVENEKSLQKVSAGSSPESENNYGDRQILGVIASPADIKNLNGVSSTTTPCCSGEDQPGIGTVGRYWRRRGTVGDVAEGEVSSFGLGVLGSVEAS